MKILALILAFWHNPYLDSLRNVTSEISKKELTQVNQKAFELLHEEQYDLSKELSEFAIYEATQLGQQEETLRAKACLGVINSKLGNDSSAISQLIELKQEGLHEKLSYLYQDYMLALGKSFFRIGAFDRGSLFYTDLATHFLENQDPSQAIATYNKLGTHYSKRGFYNEGLNHFLKAYDLSREHGIEEFLPDINRYLGMVYNRLGDFINAEKFIEISLKNYQEEGNDEKIGDAYLALAGVFAFSDQNDSAHFTYHQALSSYEKAENKIGMVYTGLNMSDYFHELGNVDSARYYLNLAEENNQAPYTDQRIGSYIRMKRVDAYNAKGEYNKALSNAREILLIAGEMGDLEALRQGYFSISSIYERSGTFDSALVHYKKYASLSDSLFNDETQRKFANQRIEIETLEKESEIRALQQEARLKDTYNLSLIIAAILLSLSLIAIYMYFRAENKRKAEALKNTELQIQFNQQELSNHTLSMILKNNFLNELEGRLDLLKTANGSAHQDINRMIKDIQLNRQAGKEWEKFQTYFGKAHPDFYKKIKLRYPSFTASELRQCALLKMNLSLKESAEILGVDYSSVKMARYRMKKKIGLPDKENLHSAIVSI